MRLIEAAPPTRRLQRGLVRLDQARSTTTSNLAEEGLQRGEAIGIAIALIILIVVFGTVVAAVVPSSWPSRPSRGLGLTALIGQLFELSFFVTNMITMIGPRRGHRLLALHRLAVSRGAPTGLDKIDAIERAGGTASRAVFFSGLIVVLALSAMLLVPRRSSSSLGLGAIAVVVVAVAAALTLLPAVLSLLGDNIDRLRVRKAGHGSGRGAASGTVSVGP